MSIRKSEWWLLGVGILGAVVNIALLVYGLIALFKAFDLYDAGLYDQAIFKLLVGFVFMWMANNTGRRGKD